MSGKSYTKKLVIYLDLKDELFLWDRKKGRIYRMAVLKMHF